MSFRASQDRWVMVKHSDKMWFTRVGNVKPLQHFSHENPMNIMKSKKQKTNKKNDIKRSVGAQYATGEEWRNNSRKNEENEPK